MNHLSCAAITLDIDWTPDFVIDAVAERLLALGTRATWFVTHASAAVDRLRRHPGLFELGIHPNFLPNSTHGSTVDDVLETCRALVPGATSMRTHGLVQSTPLLERVMAITAVTTDVSIFLPHATSTEPVEYWWQDRMLLRVPFLWEDDFEFERPSPTWELGPLLDAPGARVFNFHPIHVYLNSPDLRRYRTLKERCAELGRAEPDQVADLIHRGRGTGTAFADLARRLADGRGTLASEFRSRPARREAEA